MLHTSLPQKMIWLDIMWTYYDYSILNYLTIHNILLNYYHFDVRPVR